MAKYHGEIGYKLKNQEIRPGYWDDVIIEKTYRGDIIRDTRRWSPTDQVTEDLTLNNSISILADAFAYQNFHSIIYIKWMGSLWKIQHVEVQRPRLILMIGGIYNGPKEDER